MSPAELVAKACLELLTELSDSERIEVVSIFEDNFCLNCGTKDLPCHCWNDE